MYEAYTRVGKIKNTFEKAATGQLVPNNFGRCLLAAVNDGLFSKEKVAEVLNTEENLIHKIGNNLKPRQIASVSRALIGE